MGDFEKLGAFYLGKRFDGITKSLSEDLLLYDAKDLTTHALCVGMTGSGKTGLCIGILEEAAIDNIPAIVIDPKGDIGNLMLTFPELRGSDFRPWIDESEALRKGQSPDAFAQKMADTWREGLADWGQSPERISRLKNAADVSIYTPGSSAGLSLSILKSFSAPSASVIEDTDAFRDVITSAVSGLLALLGIEADPVQSREHILLSNILEVSWRGGNDLKIADLIRAILDPPFDNLGIFDIETFYPSAERNKLAMQLNNMLASPSFSSWMEGDKLDIERLLYTPEGKARISILSIAHLAEAERMFFVTLVLNELISWMRRQAGTSSLRALFYMDEIYGYFPPSANPPSKKPMLTLLKQARAYGLGCVLATQNPVDLDYKGLGNTGTWFIGRLQTERDKLRVLDGLEGASATAGQVFRRAEIDTILSGLGKRVFLMNNVHDSEPILFQTRWVLSYLRGPMTRSHIELLMRDRKSNSLNESNISIHEPPAVNLSSEVHVAKAPGRETSTALPILPASVSQAYFPIRRDISDSARLVYRPALFATAQLHFVNARAGVDEWVTLATIGAVPADSSEPVWDDAMTFKGDLPELSDGSARNASFIGDFSSLSNPKNFPKWARMLKSELYRSQTMTLFECPEHRMLSTPDEDEGTFRMRVSQTNREARDEALEKLKGKYSARFTSVTEKIRRTEQRVEREESQYERSRMSTAVSIGSTLLGALMGRKAVSMSSLSRAATSMNKAGSALREKSDIDRAMKDVESARAELSALEEKFRLDTEALGEQYSPDIDLKDFLIRPRKSDISVSDVTIVWMPWEIDTGGLAKPAY